MEVLRTPEARFDNLPGYDFEPHYTEVFDGEGGTLRIHHVEQGPVDGEVVLCLHGQPTWSYLYRKMIPVLADAGFRAIAPDLVGFGKSDKPTRRSDYAYARHISWIRQWIQSNELTNITLVCQDWGGLIGLRVVASYPDRFARLVIANTGLPDSSRIPIASAQAMHAMYASLPIPADIHEVWSQFENPADIPGFLYWRKLCDENPDFRPRHIVEASCQKALPDEAILDAYNAPFPDPTYLSGVREFPSLVPIMPDDPEVTNNDMAWNVLRDFKKPVLTVFSDGDPVTSGGDKVFHQRIPGTKGQSHTTIAGTGHFLQEESGEEFAEHIIEFVSNNR